MSTPDSDAHILSIWPMVKVVERAVMPNLLHVGNPKADDTVISCWSQGANEELCSRLIRDAIVRLVPGCRCTGPGTIDIKRRVVVATTVLLSVRAIYISELRIA